MSRTRDTANLVRLIALNAEGGRVGIGTTTRSNQLTVEGDTLIVGVITATTFDGDLTLDNVGISSIISSAEAFVDNDTSLMTAAAIKDIIPTGFSATQGQLLQHNGSSVVGISSEAYSDFVTDCTQGYYAYTTDAYTVGVANTIQELTEDVWNLLQPQVAATYNHQTHQMTAGNNGNPFVGSGATIGTGQTEFSLAGMSAGANCLVRIAFSYTPDIDDSDLDIRLFFTTNPATQGTGLTNFSIDKQALVITQGADEVYPGEILIPFFVGNTLTGVSTANAGSFRIEAKPSDPGDLEMKAVTVAVDN